MFWIDSGELPEAPGELPEAPGSSRKLPGAPGKNGKNSEDLAPIKFLLKSRLEITFFWPGRVGTLRELPGSSRGLPGAPGSFLGARKY